MVLADGTAARSGGHVIKNVAGYDLTKLLHGAQGTLGAVAELVLRLHPVPEAVRPVAVAVAADGVDAAARRVLDSPVEVAALQWTSSGTGGGRLLARVEGTPGGVEGRVRRLAEALGGDAAELSADDADAAWASHDAAVDARPDDGAVLRVGVLPSRLARLLAELDRAVGLRSVTTSPATGVATLTVAATADAVTAVHERFAAAGGTSTLRHRPAGVELPAFGPPPSSAALLRAVAAVVDPDQRFGRGRLAPWVPLPATTTTGAPRDRHPAPHPRDRPLPGLHLRAWRAGRARARRRPRRRLRQLRRPPPAGAGAARRLRALRVLPADLPHLRALGRGDGLAARADLPHADGRERGDPARRGLHDAHGPLPGVHGLRDRVPVRGAVRPAARGHPAADRAHTCALAVRPAVPRGDLHAVPLPAPAAGGLARWARSTRSCARRAWTACWPGCRGASSGSWRWSRCCRRSRCATRSRGPPRTPPRRPAPPTRRGRVGMLTGCVQDVFFHQVNLATVRVLAAEGYDVVAPREQGCCGALGLHAGREEESVERAKALIAVFERAAGGRHRGERGRLRLVDEGVRRTARRRAGVGRAGRGVLGEGPRHLRGAGRRPRGLPGAAAPGRRDRRLPRRVPPRARPEGPRRSRATCCARSRAWTLAELPEAEICCGSAGIYNMLQPEAAGDLGRRKADNIRGTGADLLVTANPGCLLQIRKYLEGELPMLHPVQLLDASIRGVRPPGM